MDRDGLPRARAHFFRSWSPNYRDRIRSDGHCRGWGRAHGLLHRLHRALPAHDVETPPGENKLLNAL